MDRTLIVEIAGGVIAIGMTTAVGNLMYQVDENKTHITELTEQVAAGKAAGEAEIKRSTAIDVSQAGGILGNDIELAKQDDEINLNKTAIAVLYERTGHHIQKEKQHYEPQEKE